MKNKFKKILTCLLSIVTAIVITIPNLISDYNSSIITYACDYGDAEYDAYLELENALLAQAGDWGTAIYQDHITPGYFHDEIIDYIEERSEGLYKGELPITFKTSVINPTTGKKTSSGRADIYTVDDGITYLWEVKPASYYIDDGYYNRKSKGEEQLKNYVDSNEYFENGKDYPDSSPLIWLSGVIKVVAPSSAIYEVTFLPSDSNNGLILYWFKRIQKPREEKEKVKDEVKDSVSDEVNNYIDDFNEQLEASEESASDYSFDSTGNIVDSNGNIIITRNKIIFYTGICSALLTYYGKLLKTKNPPSTAVEGYEVIIFIHPALLSHKAHVVIAALATIKLFVEVNDIDCHAAGIDDIEYDEEEDEGKGGLNDPEDEDSELQEDISTNSSDYDKSGKENPPRDPLIIHFSESEEIELSTLDDGVNFDLDNNGFAEKTAWIKNNDGFLVFDVNGNGIVDNGSEFFGDQFIKSDGNTALTGFEALSDFDMNDDGKIDKDDLINDEPVFNHLYVWFDTKRNGKTDEGELVPITDFEISYIDLNYTPDNDNNLQDTGVRREDSSFVYFENCSPRKISEFWFPVNSTTTTYDGEISIGKVKNIWQAVYEDESDELYGYIIAYSNAKDVITKRYYLKKILYFITDSSNIETDSRGGNIDARELNVIEKFMGYDFEGVDGSNPNINAAKILQQVYANIEDAYCNYLNQKFSFGGYKKAILDYNDSHGIRNIDFSFLNHIIESKLNTNDDNVDCLIYDLGVYLKAYDRINQTSKFDEYYELYADRSEHLNDIVEYAKSINVFVGTASDDKNNGTAFNDYVFGEAGNDVLSGNDGDDRLYGGLGNDILSGGNGNDSYYFDIYHGNDIIHDTSGNSIVIFSENISYDDYSIKIDVFGGVQLVNKITDETISLPDFIHNPEKYTFIFDGEETILGGGNREIFEGTSENDIIEGGDGFNIFYGGDGDDVLNGGKDMDFMYGGEGNDTLNGRNGLNVMFGEGGDDTLYAGDDGSYLSGGDGNDKIYGGGGADVLDGGKGNDFLQGDHGDNTYIYGKGYDNDLIDASSDNNTILIKDYTTADMKLSRNLQNDLIIRFGGTSSNDRLTVDHFFDYNSNRDISFIFETEGDKEYGQYDITENRNVSFEPAVDDNNGHWMGIYVNDNVEYHALGGNDMIGAGTGNDILDGGSGDDTLSGSTGTDTYIFAKGYDHDTINEWSNEKSIIKLFDITSDEVEFVENENNSNSLDMIVKGTEDVLTISNFRNGNETYEFRFADLITGTVDKDTLEFIATEESVKLKADTIAAAQEAFENEEEFVLDDTDWVNIAYMHLDEGLECFGDPTKIFNRTSLFIPITDENFETVDKTYVGQVPVREVDTIPDDDTPEINE